VQKQTKLDNKNSSNDEAVELEIAVVSFGHVVFETRVSGSSRNRMSENF